MSAEDSQLLRTRCPTLQLTLLFSKPSILALDHLQLPLRLAQVLQQLCVMLLQRTILPFHLNLTWNRHLTHTSRCQQLTLQKGNLLLLTHDALLKSSDGLLVGLNALALFLVLCAQASKSKSVIFVSTSAAQNPLTQCSNCPALRSSPQQKCLVRRGFVGIVLAAFCAP